MPLKSDVILPRASISRVIPIFFFPIKLVTNHSSGRVIDRWPVWIIETNASLLVLLDKSLREFLSIFYPSLNFDDTITSTLFYLNVWHKIRYIFL